MEKCKYPNEVCVNMALYHGVAYCDSVPCSLKDELPKRTNYEKIKGMRVEELAEFLTKQFCHGIGADLIKEWLESEAEI